ncbi:hypothetical protein L910_2412 [Vibrio fluvialis PG41]|uniref:Uncharacterized protein n=1 Tax=Vibrio fluvialis PG41 TaxID=1336752 RepID=S7HWZ6_VIBFL|nr:hypothetical protein [Vibrio fluvialis]EPP20213.1 hypothetical protein L910_2412 [Vibrio fluvialis PG41]
MSIQNEEMTKWLILSKIEEDNNTLGVLDGISKHPNMLSSAEDKTIFFHEFRKYFQVEKDDYDLVDKLHKKISDFHFSEQGDSLFVGIKFENSIISIGMNGSFSIVKQTDNGFEFTKHSYDRYKGFISKVLSDMHKDMIDLSPKLKVNQAIRAATNAENLRRELRIKNVPPMPEDFWEAIQRLADYSENFQEFQILLRPNMDDISDRCLTRLGRASEILERDPDLLSDDDYEFTVYRCLPAGKEIEAGDWVTTDIEYAKAHISNVKGEWEIIERSIAGNELIVGADPLEMYYAPRSIWGDLRSIQDVWKSVTYRKPMKYESMERIVNRALKEQGLTSKDVSAEYSI